MNSKTKELEEKVALYEYILDNVHAGIWLNSIEKSLWINKRTAEITGCTVEELNEMGIEEFQKRFNHPDDADLFEESKKYLIDREIGYATTIFRQKDKDGNWLKVIGSNKVSKWSPEGFPLEAVNCAIVISEELSGYTKIEDLLKENAILKHKLKLKDLTRREFEIIRQIAGGFSTKQIADKENISFHTVEAHRKNIMRKLAVNNLADLVRFATECGLY